MVITQNYEHENALSHSTSTDVYYVCVCVCRGREDKGNKKKTKSFHKNACMDLGGVKPRQRPNNFTHTYESQSRGAVGEHRGLGEKTTEIEDREEDKESSP